MKHFCYSPLAILLLSSSVFAQNPPAPILPASPNNTMVIFGDSNMANADTASVNIPCLGSAVSPCGSQYSGNYATWVSLYSGNRVIRVPSTGNFGVNGDTTTGMLARIGAVIAAAGPGGLVLMQSGSNDPTNGISCTTTKTNNRAMYARFKAAGVNVIKTTTWPRSGGAAYTAAQALNIQCANWDDRRYMELNNIGFYFVDLDPIMVDPTQATWLPPVGSLTDGVHLAQPYGSAVGFQVSQPITQLYPLRNYSTSYAQSDVYDATNFTQGNLLPIIAGGTAGSVINGDGAGTHGTCSGTVVSNYVLDCIQGAGATIVASVITLPDNRKAQVLTFSGNYTTVNATSSLPFVDFYNNFGNQISANANINIADTIEGRSFFSIGNSVGISGPTLQLFTVETGQCGGLCNAIGGQASNLDQFPPTGTNGFIPVNTARRTTAGACTLLELDFRIFMQNQTGTKPVSGTMTISDFGIRKVVK